jgi:bacterial/archaeal transporter family protein
MKNSLHLLFLVVTQALGDIFLSKGMKQFGEIRFEGQTLVRFCVYVFTTPWIGLGIVMLIGSLLLYMAAISRLNLSYVLPIHSFTHVLNALFAWLMLGEMVSGLRWLATAMITVGVFIVGCSQREDHTPNGDIPNIVSSSERTTLINPVLFLFPLGVYLSQIWSLILLVVCADAAGDLLTAVGMKQVGKVTFRSGAEMLKIGWQIFTNRVVLSAILCHAIAFFIFILLLNRADISFIRPATALTYVFSLLGARFILKEPINRARVIGITVIGSGVAMIGFS